MALIRKIHNKEVTATVKEDGSAVTVGIDSDGARYVSREGKVGVATERFYHTSGISLEHPGVNTALYIAAKMWIESEKTWVIGGKPGDAWNCEVVSSGLNVIEYNHTSLIMLHPIENSVTKELSTPLSKMAFAKAMGEEIMIPTWFMNAYDRLDVHYVKRHASVRFVWSADLPDVSKIIAFFKCEVEGFGTIESILSRKLTEVDSNVRIPFKAVRDSISTSLISLVKNLETDPEMEREGIVLNDGGNLIKVVNPLFVEANQFQHSVRNCIKKRTFSNDFARFFPTCPEPLIKDVDESWKMLADDDHISTHVERHMLRVMLYTMRDHYVRAQHQKKLYDPTGIFGNQYPSHAHQATLIAFKVAIESLNGS